MSLRRLALALLAGLGCAGSHHAEAVTRPPTCPSGQLHLVGVLASPVGSTVQGRGAATVALIPVGSNSATALATSDTEGKFAFCAPPGTYSVTATARGMGPAFAPPRAFPAGLATMSLEPEAATSRLTGHVEAYAPRGPTFVRLVRVSDATGDVFYGEVAADGTFDFGAHSDFSYRVDLDGDYRAEPLPLRVGNNAASLTIVGYPKEVVAGPPDADTIAWIRSKAIPLRTTNPTGALDDLAPLKDVVGDATIVGMGENSHGAREFFQLKHRVLRFLVERMGFTVFAMEVGFAEGTAINDYVHGGPGDLRKLVSEFGYWTWDTQEILDLIEWMRAYNQDSDHPHKISFYGIDMQLSSTAYARVMAYLKGVDPQAAETFASELSPLASENLNELASLNGERKRAIADATHALLARFDSERAHYTSKEPDGRRWKLARQHAVVLAQVVEFYGSGSDSDQVRDRAMADNMMWTLEFEGPGARAMLWAHNGHVGAAPDGWKIPIGAQLRERLGRRYVAAGLFFGQGVFRAWDLSEPEAEQSVRPISVTRPPEGYIDGALGLAGVGDFALDLRVGEGKGARWFGIPHPMRRIAANYLDLEGSTDVLTVGRRYDVLFYVDTVSGTCANPTGLRGPHSR